MLIKNRQKSLISKRSLKVNLGYVLEFLSNEEYVTSYVIQMLYSNNCLNFPIGEDTLVNEKKKIVESIRHDCDNELSEVIL